MSRVAERTATEFSIIGQDQSDETIIGSTSDGIKIDSVVVLIAFVYC